MNNHLNDTESNNNSFEKMALRKEEMIFKQMIDNIDEALPIVTDKANSFSFNSYARGYHAYMKNWNPVDGEVLVCTRETDIPHDNYAVSIIRNSYVVCHVPLGLSKTFSNFLSLPASTMLCIVTGKRLNREAGLGLEIPVMYQARGHKKAIQWLKKTITKILLRGDDLGSKFKSK